MPVSVPLPKNKPRGVLKKERKQYLWGLIVTPCLNTNTAESGKNETQHKHQSTV